MYLLKHRWSKLARNAWKNRQELIAAGMTSRRDLLKLGLLSAGGMLLAKHGLSSRVASAGEMESPYTREFVEPLPIMPVKRPLANGASGLSPYPTIEPNHAGGEGRMRTHQAFGKYPAHFPWPPQKVFEVRQREGLARVSPSLPLQKLWGFDGLVPGPTYHARYGEQILIRNRNELPANNGGFGMPQVSTHLHNAHTPSESDGFPGDFFPNPDVSAIANATFYDQHYPNAVAGFSDPLTPQGGLNESLSTLWYHDHRVGFTAQNTYKGLIGFYLLFNDCDCGDETNPYGCRLPGVRDSSDFYAPVRYDIPLMLADRLFDEDNGRLYFDLFEKDGILGDKFLVNGKIQPYLYVQPRRYRFRVLDVGPSRFYQLFLTDRAANTSIPFWQVANDGNLLPMPLKVSSIALGVAERADIVVDFRPWAGKTLYLENRLLQLDGRGPQANIGESGSLKAPGTGNFLLQFRVSGTPVADNSLDLEINPQVQYYALPARVPPRLQRVFRLKRSNSVWTVNDKIFPDDASTVHFRVKLGAAEEWTVENEEAEWMHPLHIHQEEFQILRRNNRIIGPGDVEYARKDVMRAQHNETNTIYIRFRDFEGRYLMHCHNIIHEDHAQMVRFDIDDTGDWKEKP